jgi:hypothetical protein
LSAPGAWLTSAGGGWRLARFEQVRCPTSRIRRFTPSPTICEYSQGNATGDEWRTAPLWGIGLQEIVSDHAHFLHDSRARNLTEAIMWYGLEGLFRERSLPIRRSAIETRYWPS